jgi:hypothetical protein
LHRLGNPPSLRRPREHCDIYFGHTRECVRRLHAGGVEPCVPQSLFNDNNCYEGDDRLRSFVFTLRNPHGLSPGKLALRAKEKQWAIYYNSTCCAGYGGGDIHMSSNSEQRESDTLTLDGRPHFQQSHRLRVPPHRYGEFHSEGNRRIRDRFRWLHTGKSNCRKDDSASVL